uniref:Uncharacterized protein n=1 Tax=Physcomitrium patens TaxID=3218 RepID=A0A2K1J3V0_PHYPA|nr:hypothetical protein PHYPA_022060 [Physcomitrium patens]
MNLTSCMEPPEFQFVQDQVTTQFLLLFDLTRLAKRNHKLPNHKLTCAGTTTPPKPSHLAPCTHSVRFLCVCVFGRMRPETTLSIGFVSSAAKGKLEDAGNYLGGKADDALDTARDVSRDAQNEAEKLGDKAADKGREIEGSAKSAGSDVRGEAGNLGNKAQNAVQDAGDSLKENADKATSSAQRKAEDVGDSARDTAHDLKRDAQKGADRIQN